MLGLHRPSAAAGSPTRCRRRSTPRGGSSAARQPDHRAAPSSGWPRLPDRKGKITFMAPGGRSRTPMTSAWNTDLATLWQADRPALLVILDGLVPGAGALVKGLGASSCRSCHAVPAVPAAGHLAGRTHRRGRPAGRWSTHSRSSFAAECGQAPDRSGPPTLLYRTSVKPG